MIPEKLRFEVIEPDAPRLKPTRFPTALLLRDRWDDFGFKTNCVLTLYLSKDEIVQLGDVKIIQKGQSHGYTPLPDQPFSALGDEYCSLGQAFSYYESLNRLGRAVYGPMLRGLRDVTVDATRLARFEYEHAFQVSLLRSSAAALALKDAPALFGRTPVAITYCRQDARRVPKRPVTRHYLRVFRACHEGEVRASITALVRHRHPGLPFTAAKRRRWITSHTSA
jgi:hypothetical protein